MYCVRNWIYHEFKIILSYKNKKMENLKISNSCVNCDNLNHTLKKCGIHQIEVSEKYTCDEFETSN